MISKKSRGFSLAEVIIAMVLIVIMSFSAFSVINFSVNSGNKNTISNFFEVETQNYLKAYFLGEDGYENSMKLLTGQDCAYGEDIMIKYDNNFEITESSTYYYYVQITFGEEVFSVSCYDRSNELIYSKEVWYE